MSVDQTILEKHGIKEINVETDQSIREKKMEKDKGKGGGTEALNITSSKSEGNSTARVQQVKVFKRRAIS